MSSVRTRGFVIVGMHRSGTSSLMGLLESSGVWLGDATRKVAGARSNPKGNRERKPVCRANDAILARTGGTWDDPPDEICVTDEDRLRIDELVMPYAQHEPWAVKDPRMVLTLPAWLEHLPSAELIGAYRHPMAVARSLRTRNGFEISRGLGLWVRYTQAMVDAHRQDPFPLVSFDRAGDPYLQQYRALCAELALPFDAAAAARSYEVTYVNEEADDEGHLPPEVNNIYTYLSRSSSNVSP